MNLVFIIEAEQKDGSWELVHITENEQLAWWKVSDLLKTKRIRVSTKNFASNKGNT